MRSRGRLSSLLLLVSRPLLDLILLLLLIRVSDPGSSSLLHDPFIVGVSSVVSGERVGSSS